MAVDGAAPRALLNRYELREQVGSGGMGEVWLGWDRRLQRDVAVKRLLPQLSAEPSYRQRFEVEARAAAILDHPNVVDLYDIDEDDGTLFLVMERLPGPSLDHTIAAGPLSEAEVRQVATDMLTGLGAAHAAHLLHRDIKPGNLIRSAGGRWKIGDFGVAKDLASAAQLTLVGVAVGTPAYLAPDQLEGQPATPGSDLWAAGVVLREALTGHRPFPGDDPIAVAHAVRHTRLAPLAQVRPDLDPHLAAAIDRALSADPAHRFTSAAEMQAVLDGRSATAPVPAAIPAAAPLATAPPRPRSRLVPLLWAITGVGAAILAVLLVALLVGAVMVGEDDLQDDPPTAPTTATTSESPATDPSSDAEAPDPSDPPPASTTDPVDGDGPFEDPFEEPSQGGPLDEPPAEGTSPAEPIPQDGPGGP
ncbi:hypothetical protein BH24ACT4_BH24ACT4_07550 [soil metagenome]